MYFNVIKAIRMIFSDFEFETSSEDLTEVISSAEVQKEISSLRMKLLPLMALETTLTSELNGGISLAGGRTGAYVRSGWQSLIKPSWSRGVDLKKAEVPPVDDRIREITNLVARTMSSSADDIEALWSHEVIRYCIKHRKIRLDECAA